MSVSKAYWLYLTAGLLPGDPMHHTTLTERGTIPARTDCPFLTRCEIATAGNCVQKGPSQGASVSALINDPTMASLVRKLPSAQKSVQLVDNLIAEVMSTGHVPVDGFIELSYVLLLERGQDQGLSVGEIQFVLNAIDRDCTSMGGRDAQGNWMDQPTVLSILRGAALKDPEATRAAQNTTAVIRIAAFHPVEFSCGAARGFAIAEGQPT